MTWPTPVRVVGVGSPLGDDAVAWAVVRLLRESSEWSAEVEFHTIEGGQRLLEILDGRGSLVLIDALAHPERAGTIHRFDWPDPRIDTLSPGSTHHLRPAESLQLAATLGLLPPRVAIWAIAGACFSPGRALSADVAASVPVVARRIAEELSRSGVPA